MLFQARFTRLSATFSILSLLGGTAGLATNANAQEEEVLEEVIVTGYMTQQKSHVTGSVASVDVDEMTKFIAHDPTIALQSRVAGVQVLTEGGLAGAEAKVIIRGSGTFGNTEPLYIIDGAFSANGMSGLNPNDIQSIEVLKDGAAAAQYGVRAANGVVVITTKRGVSGEPVIEIGSSFSFQQKTDELSYVGAEQWRSFNNQVAANDGIAPAPENVNPVFSQGVDTDWQDLWFDDAFMYQTDLSISGGTDSTRYRVSFSYLDQESIIAFSDYKKANGRVSLDFDFDRLKIDTNLGVSYSTQDPLSGGGILGGRRSASVLVLPPTVPVTDSEGNFVVAGSDFYLSSENMGNPYAQAAIDDHEITNLDLIGNLDFWFEFVDGLRFNLGLSGNYIEMKDLDRDPAYSWEVLGDPSLSVVENTTPGISESLGTRFDYTLDFLLYYDADWGNHSISTVGGYTQTNEDYRETGYSATFDNVFEEQLRVVNGDATVTGFEAESLLESWIGSLNYYYDSRYLATITVRHDKSSKFGSGNNSDTFPSGSIGWNVHEEDFFSDDFVLSSLKLTASYGELGANFIRPYQFTSLAFGPLPAIFGDNQNGPNDRSFGRVTQLLDPNLRWETSTSYNFGAEFGLLDDRLLFTAEYYNKTNDDILAPVPLPPSAGQQIFINVGESPDVNAAEVENDGLEFTVNFDGEFKEISYNISGNLATLNNEVTTLGENVVPINSNLMSGSFDDRPSRTDTGHPLGGFYGYTVTGTDAGGNFVFQDINGRDANGDLTGQPDGIINDDDKTYIGDPNPDYTWGLNFSGYFRDWDFSLFVDGSHGADVFNQKKYDNYFLYNSSIVSDALNAWTPSNTDTGIPIATLDNSAGGNALPSTFYIEDGSFVRLRSLQVGYTVPPDKLSRWSVEELRVYFSAQNVYTWTDYTGYDPQVSANALFDRGIDFRGYPNTRTYSLGFDLSFE